MWSRCTSASSSGLYENSGLKFDQFRCTNGCPCGACGTCSACVACGAGSIAGACGASGTTGPGWGGGVEGLEDLVLHLPSLTYVISNFML